MIIQSIKPATLHIQNKTLENGGIKICTCYLLQGLDSPMEAKCRGKYIKSHQKQNTCLDYIKDFEDISLYKPLRLKKYPKVV